MAWRIHDLEEGANAPIQIVADRVASVLARFDDRRPFIAEVRSCTRSHSTAIVWSPISRIHC